MSEELRPEDLRTLWKSQELEAFEVNMQSIISRRTRELRARTRTEIIGSLFAALAFAALAGWRFVSPGDSVLQAALVLVIVWTLISVYRFRRRIWSREAHEADALAAPAIEHYRRELEKRRDHLRSIWTWNGPILMALLFMVLVIVRKVAPNFWLLRNAIPFLALTAVWTIIMIRQRRLQAREIQQEIDELGR